MCVFVSGFWCIAATRLWGPEELLVNAFSVFLLSSLPIKTISLPSLVLRASLYSWKVLNCLFPTDFHGILAICFFSYLRHRCTHCWSLAFYIVMFLFQSWWKAPVLVLIVILMYPGKKRPVTDENDLFVSLQIYLFLWGLWESERMNRCRAWSIVILQVRHVTLCSNVRCLVS